MSKTQSKSTTSCVLLNVWAISTSDFEYEWYEYDIKISMKAYKKLWEWFDSTRRFEYSLLISDRHQRQVPTEGRYVAHISCHMRYSAQVIWGHGHHT